MLFSVKKILETKQYASFLRVSILECQTLTQVTTSDPDQNVFAILIVFLS